MPLCTWCSTFHDHITTVNGVGELCDACLDEWRDEELIPFNHITKQILHMLKIQPLGFSEIANRLDYTRRTIQKYMYILRDVGKVYVEYEKNGKRNGRPRGIWHIIKETDD